MSTPDWITEHYHEYEKRNLKAVKVGDILSYNDGDVCISVLTYEQLAKHAEPVCIDIGADVGWWTSFCLKYSVGAKLFTFEPNPQSFKDLENRLQGESRVQLFNKAVSDSNDQELLFEFDGPLSNSREKNGTHAVQTTTLDFLFEKHPTIHLLKIDTEGHELPILKALVPHFKKIDSMVFEFTPRWYGGHKRVVVENLQSLLMTLLEEYGCIYTVSRRGIPTLTKIDSEEGVYHLLVSSWSQSKQTDIFCCRGAIESVKIVE